MLPANRTDEDMIMKFILLPFALKVLEQDRHAFEHTRYPELYMRPIDDLVVRLANEKRIINKRMVQHGYAVERLSMDEHFIYYRWFNRDGRNGDLPFLRVNLRSMTLALLGNYLFGVSSENPANKDDPLHKDAIQFEVFE
ncbi:hypothetical protein Q9M42_02355 [Marinococcus luteus]|nr:hypothetical protein [Marinococcus luteus]